MPHVIINQQNLYYTHRPGRVEHPALLLVHGAGSSQALWPKALQQLPGIAVYALDLPGHAESDPPGRSTIEDYAADVLAFIKALALDYVVVMGHSMGGAIAQLLALQNVPQVAGLVLAGTGARLRVSPAILDSILQNFDSAVNTIIKYAWPANAPAQWVDLHRQILIQTGPNVLHGDFSACNKFDVMGRLDQIKTPTLVMTGTADQLTPLKYGQYLAGQISRSQFVPIEGAGHFAALEQPDNAATAVERFLSNL